MFKAHYLKFKLYFESTDLYQLAEAHRHLRPQLILCQPDFDLRHSLQELLVVVVVQFQQEHPNHFGPPFARQSDRYFLLLHPHSCLHGSLTLML